MQRGIAPPSWFGYKPHGGHRLELPCLWFIKFCRVLGLAPLSLRNAEVLDTSVQWRRYTMALVSLSGVLIAFFIASTFPFKHIDSFLLRLNAILQLFATAVCQCVAVFFDQSLAYLFNKASLKYAYARDLDLALRGLVIGITITSSLMVINQIVGALYGYVDVQAGIAYVLADVVGMHIPFVFEVIFIMCVLDAGKNVLILNAEIGGPVNGMTNVGWKQRTRFWERYSEIFDYVGCLNSIFGLPILLNLLNVFFQCLRGLFMFLVYGISFYVVLWALKSVLSTFRVVSILTACVYTEKAVSLVVSR